MSEIAAPVAAAALVDDVDRHRLWRRFRRSRLALPSLIVLAVLVVVAVFAPLVAPHDPNAQDYDALLAPPSSSHWFGTDSIGRDIFSRVVFGSRASLLVGAGAVLVAFVGGLVIGLAAGYLGRWADEALMRVMDAGQAFPGLILSFALTAALGPSITTVAFGVGIVAVPTVARVVRGQVLVVRELDYVSAARVLGLRDTVLVVRHIFPNVVGPAIIQGIILMSSAILTEAALSFLGLGIQPPTPSWGALMRDGYNSLADAPWISMSAGAAIFLSVLAINFVGEGLRESVVDP
ncbi:glutathione ABC transporter permease GsiD [Luteimicrobium album]|uniref:Glutathione ABC transporter permease GsiD n=1 Tax=Luteimicrobium album TaxID=1054550 RepID=A0ABQ6I0E3_9MICO|nr:ABC transporter permease [Luteimicrobium album]GMA24189.1 glutathione ABC transporter permease GsiD [Luteimicrobium album]